MKNIITFLALLMPMLAHAQKAHYIPNEWKQFNPADTLLYAESDPDNRYTWSESRSVEGDNVIVYWDKFYGATRPDRLSKTDPLYVDVEDLLAKCEAFFKLEVEELGFVNPATSNLSRYKVMVLLNHGTDWICYGGGYDYRVSALWLSPSTCHPVGSAVAHEVGHSFHYMCYGEDSNYGLNTTIQTGFHSAVGKGATIWEQTAQWQSLQSYPDEIFSQSIDFFRRSHNYAFSHEWHRYQSYWFLVYLDERFGRHAVADVWNHRVTAAKDFNEVLMSLRGIRAADEDPATEDLSMLYLDYAMRCATWDFAAAAPYRDAYVGDFRYACCPTADSTYQVAFSSTPQCSGFNIIPLQVPAAGTQVTTHFTALRPKSALAAGDPAEYLDGDNRFVASGRSTYLSAGSAASRAFRLGYVALLNDGTRQYIYDDKLYCKGSTEASEEVTCTVPADTRRLWLVVVPAPRTYVQHQWDDTIEGDDQWPYTIRLYGTDLADNAIIHAEPIIDGRPIADCTLTYDVQLPVRSDYTAVPVTINSRAAQTVGTALQKPLTDIPAAMTSYTANGPADGKVMFYAFNAQTLRTQAIGSTANGYGHWFNANGTAASYGSASMVYSEFDPVSMTFNIGQYPGHVKAGDTFTIAQCLRYRVGSSYARANIIFRVQITSGESGYILATMQYDDPTAIAPPTATAQPSPDLYTLDGRRAQHPHRGIYIRDGRKVFIP